jgi:hypothetical protein
MPVARQWAAVRLGAGEEMGLKIRVCLNALQAAAAGPFNLKQGMGGYLAFA